MKIIASLFVALVTLSMVSALTFVQLQQQFQGKILQQSTGSAFNDARFGYNYRYNRIPRYILQCTSTNDVLLALDFAQTGSETATVPQLQVSVRSGGHSAEMFGVLDDRIVIDVSLMKNISVDINQMTITAQPGLKWVEFYNYTINNYQVGTPGGSCPSVGIGGLSLGGGANDLSTVYGMNLDNILELEVVLANRTVVTASYSQNPDLFWALRGAGHGGFGIVTRMTYRAHSLRPKYYSAWITYNWSDFETVLAKVSSFAESMPDIINLYFTAFVSGNKAGNQTDPIINLSCFSNGDPLDAEQYCGQFRNFDGVTPVSFFTTTQSYYDTVRTGTDPKFRRSFTKGSFLTELSKKSIKRIKTVMESSPITTFNYNTARLNLYWQGGQMLNQERNFTAYVHRTYPWNAVWLASYVTSEMEDTYHQWINKATKKMEPFSSGEVYQNYPDAELENWQDAYYAENYDRLVQIKAAYDPTNYFSYPQSI
ncbi:hypothetical protein DFA_08728 [Cavenderia fasciculata]|uniref:FAD-binding PCMH-type domain-containing protein n=1 Tax=Cavenderia fasciculata TaxID=261658 RepID=F4Q3X3_CACFS|nr:uncharacterized protein DFA_08728 [Cavenderia fasciculata]EGG17729.1 hypothetical protein DFA_08728 [Cavenderia fasciculata]|eukprot:XP_004356213.1 hypothetical protein DFA_08728 [Cavenderia fasciculata]